MLTELWSQKGHLQCPHAGLMHCALSTWPSTFSVFTREQFTELLKSHACVWRQTYVCHDLCVAVRGQPQVSALICHLVWDSYLLQALVYTMLAGLQASGDSLVSASHLIVGLLGYRHWVLNLDLCVSCGSELWSSCLHGLCFIHYAIEN